MSNVDAQAIARAARGGRIVPQRVENRILRAEADDDANCILFEHLLSQATLEDLREFCNIMKEAEGYSKMIDFGKKLLTMLEQVTANDVRNVPLYNVCNTMEHSS